MAKLIDLIERHPGLMSSGNPEFDAGYRKLTALPDNDASLIYNAVVHLAEAQITIGLGLVDWEGDELPPLEIYDMVQDLYDRASGDCYFCSDKVDPMAEPFDREKTLVCIDCLEKLCRFLDAINVPAERVFPNSPYAMRKSRKE